MNKPNWADKLTVAVAGLALILSIAALALTYKINDDTFKLALIQSRIATCRDISVHHYQLAQRDEAIKYRVEDDENARLIVDGNSKDPRTGKDYFVSSNESRANASNDEARALHLCTIDKNNITEVKDCVDESTRGNQDFLVLDDISEINAARPHLGKWILGC